jgi:hypothetical protein
MDGAKAKWRTGIQTLSPAQMNYGATEYIVFCTPYVVCAKSNYIFVYLSTINPSFFFTIITYHIHEYNSWSQINSKASAHLASVG